MVLNLVVFGKRGEARLLFGCRERSPKWHYLPLSVYYRVLGGPFRNRRYRRGRRHCSPPWTNFGYC